jgi:cytoskeletal protein RodZ
VALVRVRSQPLCPCNPPEKEGGAQARRFLEKLNTPLAVLVVLVVVVVVNVSLLFGHYLPSIGNPAAPSSPAPRTETTRSTPETTLERTGAEATEERSRPASAPGARTTPTATGTPTATATP